MCIYIYINVIQARCMELEWKLEEFALEKKQILRRHISLCIYVYRYIGMYVYIYICINDTYLLYVYMYIIYIYFIYLYKKHKITFMLSMAWQKTQYIL